MAIGGSLRDLVLYANTEGLELKRRMSDWAEDHEGDVTEIEAAIQPWFDNQTNLAAKVDGVQWVVNDISARAEARRALAKQLTEQARLEENAIERLKAYVLRVMQENDIKEIAGTTCKIRRQKNGGKAPVVVTVAPHELAPCHQRIKVEPDLDAIRESLESGAMVEGCSIGERGERISIK
jgi:hypothetical protein